MIDDMARLKQAMEQMDAQDAVVAQAAKDRAAQALSDAKLSFSKMAELIEQRRLLRPEIVTGIRRMDQLGTPGDAAFRNTGSALRKEGQSFRQIAEAIEFNGRPAPRHDDLAQESEPIHRMTADPMYRMASEPGEPAWLRALSFVTSIVFFPLRHPIRFLATALVVVLLFYTLRGVIGLGHQVSGSFDTAAVILDSVDKAISSVSSFLNGPMFRQSRKTSAPPTPSAPIASPSAAIPPSAIQSPPSPSPSAAPGTAPSAPPATAPAPSANGPGPPAPPSVAPAGPPVSTPRREGRGAPLARSAANCGGPRRNRYSRSPCCAPLEEDRPPAFENPIPNRMARNSRMAGPCVGGVGGCSWGGGQY